MRLKNITIGQGMRPITKSSEAEDIDQELGIGVQTPASSDVSRNIFSFLNLLQEPKFHFTLAISLFYSMNLRKRQETTCVVMWKAYSSENDIARS